jgi:hypothetical protein
MRKPFGDLNMSCWVVPSVAAELWGVSVPQILAQMNAGKLASKQEKGFTFVDVAPESPVFEPQRQMKFTPAPPTYRIVSREELTALLGEDAIEDSQDDAGDWRIGRSEASRMRKPPEMPESIAA